MPRISAPGKASAPAGRRRKANQRQRLLAGMVTAANRDGYAAASVSSVIGEAGVSRPTFYEYFDDRDGCFLAAVDVAARRLLEETETAAEKQAEGDPTVAVIGALVGFAVSEPALARFLM